MFGLRRRAFLVSSAALLAACAAPQPVAPKPRRIGYLADGSRTSLYLEAFRGALRELGYVEGENLVIESRWADGDRTLVPGLAADLVAARPELIVVAGNRIELEVMRADPAMPIVMALAFDPVENRAVESLAHPGGNVTGLASLNADLGGKRLELLKDSVPDLSRVTVLRMAGGPAGVMERVLASAADALTIKLHDVLVREVSALDGAVGTIAASGAQGLIVLSEATVLANRVRIVDLAAKHRLPAAYAQRQFAEVGGLMTYDDDVAQMHRRAASYVDKILKGAKPADLPVERPTKFELVVNLRTARALGLTIPKAILDRATEVIS